MPDDNGLPRRVRTLEEDAAVCGERWTNQHRWNTMTEKKVAKMERDQIRLFIWGSVLFAMAGVATSFIRDALARLG